MINADKIETRSAGPDAWSVDSGDFPYGGSPREQARFLLKYAVLAPSVLNCQPWAFSVTRNEVRFFIDLAAWPEAVDPRQRDLHLSMGCAIENFVIAARRFGFSPHVSYWPERVNSLLVAAVELGRRSAGDTGSEADLFHAITQRRTDHGWYSAEKICSCELNALSAELNGSGAKLDFLTEPIRVLEVFNLVVRADAMMFSDPTYTNSLEYCMKQGIFGPQWILRKLSELSTALITAETGGSPAHLMQDASAIGVLSAVADDRETWVKAGRLFERVFLRANTLALSMEPSTLPIQREETREALISLVGAASSYPLVLFRLGYGSGGVPHTPRRSADALTMPV
ncbi:MAG TPA: hypothetical protein VGS41_04445 [Chthonomonadales bacterium]|nr:hypothetical protein [Chthonomonadales bacterium]